MITYFLDLDGVITDSAEGLRRCFEAAFETLGVSDLDAEQLDKYLGVPLPEAFRDILPSLDDSGVDKGIMAFRDAYEEYGISGNHLYDGVEHLLRAIMRKSGGTWIVTTKPQQHAVRVVEYLKIAWALKGIIGASLDETDTKTTLIATALSQAAADPVWTVMLGDRYLDVEGASDNGVLAVGALWGYGTFEELEKSGCRVFAESPADFETEFVKFLQPEDLARLRDSLRFGPARRFLSGHER